MLQDDLSAVEGMPLRMMAVMVVLAISIPLVIGSFRAYDTGRAEASVSSEIRNLISAVQNIYASGEGNSMSLGFMTGGGSLARVDSVTFGDVLGGELSSTIRYRLHGRTERIVVVESPNVPITGPGGMPLGVGQGSYRILAECLRSDTDLNSDGLSPDTYVRLSLI